MREFNEYAQLDGETEKIAPEILGVVFTMIQITSGQPIAAQRQFISQTRRLGVKAFENYFRENKTIFADAPQNLQPVVLTRFSPGTHSDVVTEIEKFVTEFQGAL